MIIFGAKGIGRVAQDIFEANGVIVYGFLDDDESLHGQEYNGIRVLGATDEQGYLKLIGKKTEAFIATDERELRKNIVEMLREKREKMPVNAVHPKADICESAHIGHGNLICSGVRIGVSAEVGSHCNFHTGAIIEFECKVADHVQVGAGAIVGAGATLEKGVFLGPGAVVVAGVTVGKGARVGAGSVVIANVAANATVFGNPAVEMGNKKKS